MVLSKKQRRNWIIGISVFIVVVLAIVVLNLMDIGGGEDGQTLSIAPQVLQEDVLDFCETEQGCIDFLNEQGMPSGFLEENNLQINCLNGRCVIK